MKAGTHVGRFPHWQRFEAGVFDNGGARAAKLFKEIDLNASGGLDLKEFNLFFRRLHGEVASEDVDIPRSEESKLIEGIFKKYDIDVNGTLSLLEFKKFLGAGGFSRGDWVRVIEAVSVTALNDGPPNTWQKIELGLGTEAKVARSEIEDEELGLEDALILVFERAGQVMQCIVNGPQSDKLETIRPQEDNDNENDNASPVTSVSMAAASRRRAMVQRTTFSGIPCLEACMLLA
jgi:hypothetical protein